MKQTNLLDLVYKKNKKLCNQYTTKYMITLTGSMPKKIKDYQYFSKWAKWQHYRKNIKNEML